MSTCGKCGVKTVGEFELCLKCQNPCSQCGYGTQEENYVCFTCELEDYKEAHNITQTN